MCGLVRVRSKEDPFVSDTRVEAQLYRETDAKPSAELMVWRGHSQTGAPAAALGPDPALDESPAGKPADQCARRNHRREADVQRGLCQAPLHRADGCVL